MSHAARNPSRSVRTPVYIADVAAPQDQEPTDALVYVNWTRIGMSPFDLTIDLGYRMTDEPPAEFPVRTVMSWEQAKSLHGLLGESLSWYEETIGPIREFESQIGPAREAPDPPSLANPDEEERDA
jgi:hypothetical protein